MVFFLHDDVFKIQLAIYSEENKIHDDYTKRYKDVVTNKMKFKKQPSVILPQNNLIWLYLQFVYDEVEPICKPLRK